jgi:tetratricopeptide (TPR) repeat protein
VALVNLAGIRREQLKLDEAINLYMQALAIKPDDVLSKRGLGLVLNDLDRVDAAIDCLASVLEKTPEDSQVHFGIGLAYFKKEDLYLANRHLTEAVRLKPDYTQASLTLGNVLRALGKLAEAAEQYRLALEHASDNLSAHNNLAILCHKQGKHDEALAIFRKARALAPDNTEILFHESLVLLLQGNFECGWTQYEERWNVDKLMPPHGIPQPLWDGSTLHGKTILLHCEQGLGDSIQFIRYASLVKAKGGSVRLLCPPSLKRLFSNVAGVDLLITEKMSLPTCDVQAPLLSLPMILGTTLETIPSPIPYLRPEPALTTVWRERLRTHPDATVDEFRVGIVWCGSSSRNADHDRSIPLAALTPLASIPGVRLISLQCHAGVEQLEHIPNWMRVSLPDYRDGVSIDSDDDAFVDTAAIMESLDLVLTIDTATAHLAGALGVPVWVLLKKVPDWRWMLEREDSPWYPTMRLFRQSEAGNWDDVIGRVATEISGRMFSV